MTQATPELLEKMEIGLREMQQQQAQLAVQVERQIGAILMLRELLKEDDAADGAQGGGGAGDN